MDKVHEMYRLQQIGESTKDYAERVRERQIWYEDLHGRRYEDEDDEMYGIRKLIQKEYKKMFEALRGKVPQTQAKPSEAIARKAT
jgi:hypothetical protein